MILKDVMRDMTASDREDMEAYLGMTQEERAAVRAAWKDIWEWLLTPESAARVLAEYDEERALWLGWNEAGRPTYEAQ